MTLLFCGMLGGSRPLSSGRYYEDDRIRVVVPAGWAATRANESSANDLTSRSYVGGVLSHGRYRIYLLTHYGQTSGIQGGRFSEIAPYVSPWMSTGDPWGCIEELSQEVTRVSNRLSRVDLFFDSTPVPATAHDDCRHLHTPVRTPVWFGTYFSQPTEGYGFFLTFPLGQSQATPDEEMAFTATVDTRDQETLPVKGDQELSAFLRLASWVVGSIHFK